MTYLSFLLLPFFSLIIRKQKVFLCVTVFAIETEMVLPCKSFKPSNASNANAKNNLSHMNDRSYMYGGQMDSAVFPHRQRCL